MEDSIQSIFINGFEIVTKDWSEHTRVKQQFWRFNNLLNVDIVFNNYTIIIECKDAKIVNKVDFVYWNESKIFYIFHD